MLNLCQWRHREREIVVKVFANQNHYFRHIRELPLVYQESQGKGAQSWRLSILLLYLPRIYTPMHDRGTHFVFYGTVVLIQKKYLFRTMKNKEPLSSNMIFLFFHRLVNL